LNPKYEVIVSALRVLLAGKAHLVAMSVIEATVGIYDWCYLRFIVVLVFTGQNRLLVSAGYLCVTQYALQKPLPCNLGLGKEAGLQLSPDDA
jgi:hypothetical protein